MARAFLLVLDSFGIGATPDAARFGDAGADTLGHIAAARAASDQGAMQLPFMTGLGLGHAAALVTGRIPPGLESTAEPTGIWGVAREQSFGKDTPSGHWEMAGVPVRFDWGLFPATVPSFPAALTDALIAQGGLPGVLGNCHASGTTILEQLGDEHVRTGKPIVYTSGDSVFQIAAHEESFGLERLYALCHIARRLVDDYRVGRVIARPFIGANGVYQRTGNRHDYTVPPPAPTLLDRLAAAGHAVVSIGKIDDIFAHQGPTRKLTANGNAALFDLTLAEAASAPDGAPDGALVFSNFVDFDSLYGHRRDVAGYAAALEAFDRRLAQLADRLQPGDLVILTADHGCDPTWRGSDHTREHIPVLGFGPGIKPGSIGLRDSFADIGQTLARHLGIAPGSEGTDFALI
ncbi:MAG: phosphopentomutase [Azospirillaceae bacterium]|nr:phosphopentomutase [Azospirillaceae bacterium]